MHMVSHTGEMPYKVRLGLSPRLEAEGRPQDLHPTRLAYPSCGKVLGPPLPTCPGLLCLWAGFPHWRTTSASTWVWPSHLVEERLRLGPASGFPPQ